MGVRKQSIIMFTELFVPHNTYIIPHVLAFLPHTLPCTLITSHYRAVISKVIYGLQTLT